MRIIDKNTDFYDYLQDSTDNIVFDRRDSFLLTKEKFCKNISVKHRGLNDKYRFVLLQCGTSFWLFFVSIKDFNEYGDATDYDIELLHNWKNYNKPIKLFDLNYIDVELWKYNHYIWKIKTRPDNKYNKIKNCIEYIKNDIDQNDYKILCNMNKHITTKFVKNNIQRKEFTIPLLKACGIAPLINPQDIFYAIEEYFSLKKTASEKTDPIGVTDSDKIIMHGFDTKTSFRK